MNNNEIGSKIPISGNNIPLIVIFANIKSTPHKINALKIKTVPKRAVSKNLPDIGI